MGKSVSTRLAENKKLCQTCEICGYQPPSVTSLGIESTQEQYE